MSDPTTLTILGVVGALVLSVIWIAWRRSRAQQAPPAVQAVPKASEAENGTPLTPAEEPSDPVNSLTIGAALLALGLAGLGQYGLITQRIGLAWMGYGLGALLFVSSLWRLAPYTFEPPAPPPGDGEPNDASRKPWPFHLAWPVAVAGQKSMAGPRTAPRPTAEGPKATKPGRGTVTPTKPAIQGAGFANNWRYYTVADILYRRQPKLPPLPPEQMVVELDVPPAIEEAPVAIAEIAPATTEVRAPFSQTVITGFELPESLAVASDGRVFVWDAGQHVIHELDPEGRPINKWPVELEDSGPRQRLAISPDGRTAYLADTERGRIYRIVLGA